MIICSTSISVIVYFYNLNFKFIKKHGRWEGTDSEIQIAEKKYIFLVFLASTYERESPKNIS